MNNYRAAKDRAARLKAEGSPDAQIADMEVAELRDQVDNWGSKGPVPPYPRYEDLCEFVQRNASVKFEAYVPAVTVKRGVSIADAYASQCAVADDLKRQIEQTDKAPLTTTEAERQAVKEIENLALMGAVDFRPTMRLEVTSRWSGTGARDIAHQGSVRWPEKVLRDGEVVPHALAFCAWLFKDQLIARAKEEIAKLARPNALSIQERRKLKADLTAQLLEAERIEEVLAEKAGVPRRHGGDLRAVLQIREVAG